MWHRIKPSQSNLRIWQVSLLVVMLAGWRLALREQQIAFFLGETIR